MEKSSFAFAFTQENLLTDGEGSAGDVDDQEVTDECAMLIHTDNLHKQSHAKSGHDKVSGIFFVTFNRSSFLSSMNNQNFTTFLSNSGIFSIMHQIQLTNFIAFLLHMRNRKKSIATPLFWLIYYFSHF